MRYLKRSTVLSIALAAILFLGPKLPAARAQPESLADWPTKDYAPPIAPDKRVMFSGLGAALHSGDFENPNDPQLFADYYEKRIFPLITHLEAPGTTSPIRGTRDDVISRLHGDCKQLEHLRDKPVFDKLADITLDYMPKIALDPKWHPAVRVNAVLAMGEVKSPKTVTVLLELIRKRELHPAIKVAAMADLVQLAEHGVLADPAVAEPVVKLMTAAVKASPKNPPDSLRWMRGQAADVLGAVGSPGRTNEVFDALVLMLSDEELPLLQRGKAARALGRLKYETGVPDMAPYIKALAGFAGDALAPNLPANVRRVRSAARDVLDGLAAFAHQDVMPKPVRDLHEAMEKLDKAAVAAQPAMQNAVIPPADYLTAIADAKALCDGIAGKK